MADILSEERSEAPVAQRRVSQVFIVVPAYNEAANLPGMLTEVHEVLTECQEAFQLLVVNDGSRDTTAQVVGRLAEAMPIELLHHARNSGIGAVFETGLTAACRQAEPDDIIVVMEADGTNDPQVLPAMLERVRSGCDVVISSRYRTGGGYHRFPLFRLGLSVGANLLMRLLFPISGVRDYTIFFRAYRASILQQGFERYSGRLIERRTFAANAEILIKLQALRPRISEVPMRYRYDLKRGRSKLAIQRTIREYITFMIAMRVRQRKASTEQPVANEGVTT